MTQLARRTTSALLLAMVCLAAGCDNGPQEVHQSRTDLMDTLVKITVEAPNRATADKALQAAWEEAAVGEKHLSRYYVEEVPGEAEPRRYGVAKINHAAPGVVEVDPMVHTCLAIARDVHETTDGAFDPTVTPLLKLWHQAAETDVPPTDEALTEALELVGIGMMEMFVVRKRTEPSEIRKIPPAQRKPEHYHRMAHYVGLHKEGMALDLGGIAKGFIMKRMMRRMAARGIKNALIDAGGDVYAVGDRTWRVAINDPRYPRQPGVSPRGYAVLAVRGMAVVTSGHYQRGYEVDGKRYSHIVDPRTGQPVNRTLASVTVVGPAPEVADALATAIAVMGPDKGVALIDGVPDTECLLLEIPANQLDEEDPAKVKLVEHRSKGLGKYLDPVPARPAR